MDLTMHVSMDVTPLLKWEQGEMSRLPLRWVMGLRDELTAQGWRELGPPLENIEERA